MSIRSIAPAMLVAGLAGTGLVLGLALAVPALAAGDNTPAPLPCGEVATAIANAPAGERIGLVMQAIERKCHPLPAVVTAALRLGVWDNSVALPLPDRTLLVARATAAAYPEAETLAVRIIETGAWPDGETLQGETGVQLIRSFKNVLTTYRTHLLLDVFEQVHEPSARQAVIQTLRDSKLDEALLPALEAAYEETGPLLDAANNSIAAQPEKTPAAVHARMIHNLPEGALLNWAVRLAKSYPSDAVAAAMKARGIAN